MLELIKHIFVNFSKGTHFLSFELIILQFTLEGLLEESLVLDANNLGHFPLKELILLFITTLFLCEHDYESEQEEHIIE